MKKSATLCCVIALGLVLACGDSPSSYEIETADGHLNNARFSPDGTQLVANLAGDVDKIVVMDVDGSNMSVVLEDVSYLTAPTWTADGESLVFNDGGISQINPDGSGEEELFDLFAVVPMSPDLSPDENYVVYGSNGGNTAVNALSGDEEPTDLGVNGDAPRYSPDGTQIAYATSSAVEVMDADGENIRELITEDISYLSSVAWLPDGENLVITSQRGIELVEVDSAERSTLVDGFATMSVDVSPDGTDLVYAVNGQSNLTVVEDF